MRGFCYDSRRFLRAGQGIFKWLMSKARKSLLPYEARISRLEKELASINPQGTLVPKEWNKLYKNFELSFRGSEKEIKNKLTKRYSKDLEDFVLNSTASHAPKLLDLGSGHGEFLDVAREAGFKTYGVDLSAHAVDMCLRKSHQVVERDLLEHLRSQDGNSLDFISLIHVAEHCNPMYLHDIFKEVHRCLHSSGHFLVETPSLFSLWASQRQFYLDPTHERPVHPDYLQFLAGQTGFADCSTKWFDKVKHEHVCNFEYLKDKLCEKGKSEIDKLSSWLYGPMDFSCICIK